MISPANPLPRWSGNKLPNTNGYSSVCPADPSHRPGILFWMNFCISYGIDLTKQTSAPCYCPKEQPMPNIRAITQNKKQYLPLLLLADEQEDMIDRYPGSGHDVPIGGKGRSKVCLCSDRRGRGCAGGQKPSHSTGLPAPGLRKIHAGLYCPNLPRPLHCTAGRNGRKPPHPSLL